MLYKSNIFTAMHIFTHQEKRKEVWYIAYRPIEYSCKWDYGKYTFRNINLITSLIDKHYLW